MTRLSASVALAGVALVGVSVPAFATGGPDHKELICHPVNGAGQTGTGWTLVDVDKASSHFDQYGNPKHRSHDGRVDTYATAGVCPSSPSPTTTGGTKPSATPTNSPTTPASTPTTSTTTSATSTAPTPSPTTTTVTTPSTSTVSQPAPSATSPSTPTTPRTFTATSTASPKPSRPASAVSTTSPPSTPNSGARLAQTGFDGEAALAAVLLVLVGGGFHVARRLGRGGAHR